MNEWIAAKSNVKTFFAYNYEKKHLHPSPKIKFITLLEPTTYSFSKKQWAIPIQIVYQSLREKCKTKKEQTALWDMLATDKNARERLSSKGILKMFRKEKLNETDYLNKPRYKLAYVLPTALDRFYDVQGGNAGVVACKVGVLFKYSKIILIGMDCNYIDTGRYLESSVNHFDGDYYPDGKWDTTRWSKEYSEGGFADQFNTIQYQQWGLFKEQMEVNQVATEVVNCTEGSKLDHFRMSTLEKEL